MTTVPGPRRFAAAALALAGALALAACMLMPGRFTSYLDLKKDGHFTFAYTGEIHLLALSKLAQMGQAASSEFTPQACFTTPEPAPDGSEAPAASTEPQERTCTGEELAAQKQEWQDQQDRAAQKRKADAESMKSIMGGLDPSDPAAAEEFAQRLRRQAGWRSVEYRGDGLYEVDFMMAGTLDRDFSFPSIERWPYANSFLQVAVRNDGTVRVDAPGFGPPQGGDATRGMMQLGAMGRAERGEAAGMPVMDGSFVIRTDGAILANNTDEGPMEDPMGQKLQWAVNPRSASAPMALVKLTP